MTAQTITVVTGMRHPAAVDAPNHELTGRAAAPAGYTTALTTWRTNATLIDAIAERERREFEDSLRAQGERLRRSRTSTPA
jgi:hypothetical protein